MYSGVNISHNRMKASDVTELNIVCTDQWILIKLIEWSELVNVMGKHILLHPNTK